MRLLACGFICYSFNCKMTMQVLFKIRFPQNRCLVTSREHTGFHHIGAPYDLIVFVVFHQFGVIS